VIESVYTNQRRVSVPCGGAHRNWHFIINNNTSTSTAINAAAAAAGGDGGGDGGGGGRLLSLVYIKKRCIVLYDAPLLPYQTVIQVCCDALHALQ